MGGMGQKTSPGILKENICQRSQKGLTHLPQPEHNPSTPGALDQVLPGKMPSARVALLCTGPGQPPSRGSASLGPSREASCTPSCTCQGRATQTPCSSEDQAFQGHLRYSHVVARVLVNKESACLQFCPLGSSKQVKLPFPFPDQSFLRKIGS